MGYKTDNYDEKERLVKEGHNVIGMSCDFSGKVTYELDFEVQENADTGTHALNRDGIEKPEEKPFKEEPKRRGNPKWFKGGSK